jgi:hypothetical protein
VLRHWKIGEGTFVWADEAVYSKGQFSSLRVYAKQGPLKPYVPYERASFTAVAAIAGICHDGTVVGTLTRKKSINSLDFIAFL